VAILGVVSLLLVSAPSAQNRTNPADRPTPRMSNGRPDLSGFYNNTERFRGEFGDEEDGQHVISRTSEGSIFFDYGGANVGPGLVAESEGTNQPPYKPEYMAKVEEIIKTMYGGNTELDPQHDCKPNGIPRTSLGIMHIVQTPEVLAVMYEAAPGPVFRLIYTDGRKHPEDLDTSFFGHSIGHWEGDTLIVDTVGLNDETWLGGSQTGSAKHTSIHSDQEHVVERWSRKGDTITWEATVEDPVMFTRPWVLEPRRASIAAADDYIQPQMCHSNDKGHFILPSAEDPGLRCGWCTSERTYGLDSDKPTSPVLAEQEENRRQGIRGSGPRGGE
jgi:hypothetical protein